MKSRPGKKIQPLPIRRVPVHELFPQPGKMPPMLHQGRPKASKSLKVRRSLPSKNLLWGAVFLGLMLTAFGLIGFIKRSDKQNPFVLIDVRAIEESGHPVAAAKVFINQKPMGVTDSFGEWRRYMNFAPGESISVELVKGGDSGLKGSRSLAVPPKATGDLELQTSIEMRGPAGKLKKGLANKRPREDALPLEEPVEIKPKRVVEEVPRPVEVEEAMTETFSLDDGMSDTNDKSLGIFFEDGLSKISITALPFRGGTGTVMEKRQANVVRERVMPVLVNELQGLGLGVDRNAPWKLSLAYVPVRDQPGYIKAEINWQNPFGQAEKSAFIVGFSKTYDETGRALAALLRLHMKKTYWASKENGQWYIDESAQTHDFWRIRSKSQVSDTAGEKFGLSLVSESAGSKRWRLNVKNTQPCEAVRQRSRCMVSSESLKEAPPLQGWALRRIKLQGAIPKTAEVFVAGFQAHPVGNQQWEFWGHPGSKLKALILLNDRILYSESFVDSPSANTLVRLNPLPGTKQAKL